MRRLLSALVFAGLLAGLLPGCASTTEFVRTSKEAAPDRPAHRLVIAGVSQDEKIRRLYEQAFIAELKKSGLEGVAASDLIPSLAGLSMTDLRAHMVEFNDRGDAVLHVQLVNLVRVPALAPQDLPAEQTPPTRRVGDIDLTINAPAQQDAGGSQLAIELESNLYALPTRRLLWTGISTTHEANDPARIARSHARAVIAELKASGYLADHH